MTAEARTLEMLIRDAISATSVSPPLFFSWLGRRIRPHPPATQRTLTRRELASALHRSLAERLYADFYCRGEVLRRPPDETATGHASPQWIDRLRRENRSRGCRDEGWVEVRRDGGGLIVRKEGLTLRVEARTTRRVAHRLSVVIPNEYLNLSPGFYTAASRAPFSSRASLFRVYWNLRAEGAPLFVRLGTSLLNKARVPFRLKVVADPATFDRCDAGVLYVRRRDREVVFDALGEMHRGIRRHLAAPTPVFTKPIAPGVAVAEEPLGAESFGESRCGILAEALIRCGASVRGEESRFRRVRSAFARRGVPLHRTFLNPGSCDVYPLLDDR